VPLVQAALCWLRSGGGLSTLDAALALDAPFLQAPAPWLRDAHEQGTVRMSFAALIRRAQPATRAQAFEACVRAWPRRALPSAWAVHIVQGLSALGFPGAQVDSWNYQAAAALTELIHGMRALDGVVGELTARQFVQRLARHCTEVDFQAEGRDAPVQVLGLYESLGVRFDAMWVTGLTQNVLPEPVETTPYLPIVWQRASGAGRGNAAVMRASAEMIFAQWQCAAERLVFSAPAMEDEAAVAPCAMLDAKAWQPSIGPARTASSLATMQRIPDAQGLPFSAVHFPGGVSTISAQATCAFQAYAKYRLLAEPWPAQARGATARERGTLLHAAMAALWRDVRTQFAWLHATDAERDTWIDDAVTAGWAAIRHAVDARAQRAWPAVLPEAILASVRQAVRNWMEVEAERAPFEVIGIEKKIDIQLGPYTITGRIDRYDRLASNGVAVLDYKTGVLPPAKVLADGENVAQHPQLPLYAIALAATESVEAVAWAGTKRGNAALKGAGVAEGLFASASRAKKKPEVWQAMVASWLPALVQHAEAFSHGQAAVQPANAYACTVCQRQALCRYAPDDQQDDVPQEDDDADA
jgi:ATP-dependent helicase/nuclease subunit B